MPFKIKSKVVVPALLFLSLLLILLYFGLRRTEDKYEKKEGKISSTSGRSTTIVKTNETSVVNLGENEGERASKIEPIREEKQESSDFPQTEKEDILNQTSEFIQGEKSQKEEGSDSPPSESERVENQDTENKKKSKEEINESENLINQSQNLVRQETLKDEKPDQKILESENKSEQADLQDNQIVQNLQIKKEEKQDQKNLANLNNFEKADQQENTDIQKLQSKPNQKTEEEKDSVQKNQKFQTESKPEKLEGLETNIYLKNEFNAIIGALSMWNIQDPKANDPLHRIKSIIELEKVPTEVTKEISQEKFDDFKKKLNIKVSFIDKNEKPSKKKNSEIKFKDIVSVLDLIPYESGRSIVYAINRAIKNQLKDEANLNFVEIIEFPEMLVLGYSKLIFCPTVFMLTDAANKKITYEFSLKLPNASIAIYRKT